MRAAKVNDMMGLVLLPDNWSLDALTGQYTAEQWNTLEEAGAVFLPSAGLGSAEDGAISAVGTIGCYWSSTLRDETMAWHLYVLGLTNDIRIASYDIQGTMSIRLVADAVQ
jgi:hypothetical protein